MALRLVRYACPERHSRLIYGAIAVGLKFGAWLQEMIVRPGKETDVDCHSSPTANAERSRDQYQITAPIITFGDRASGRRQSKGTNLQDFATVNFQFRALGCFALLTLIGSGAVVYALTTKQHGMQNRRSSRRLALPREFLPFP